MNRPGITLLVLSRTAAAMRTLLFLALALVPVLCARAQGPLLIREVFSREAAVFIGADADLGQVVSREVVLFSGADADGKQLVSRELSLVMADGAPPPQVTAITISGSPSGSSVTLDWRSYNPWAVRDVQEFRIYRQDAPFTSISGLTPVLVVNAETLTATLTGLQEWRDHFFAVVAVDSLGNLNPQVVYRAFYVLTAEVISREVTLLTGEEPMPPNRQVVSREVSLCMVDAAAPPAFTPVVSQMSPDGSTVTLSWAAYNPWALRDVREFRIYRSSAPIADVSSLSPVLTVDAETLSAQLTGLPQWQDHFFAIVAVDGLGNRNPAVSYAAGYILMGQVISREVTLFSGEESQAAPYQQAVSREVSLVIGSAAEPAPVTGISSGFSAVTSVRRYSAIDLDWSSYNEAAQRDVVAYRVYAAPAFFSDITGMTPSAEVRDGLQTYTLTGLEAEQIYYVAVVAVDSLGGSNPTVYSVSAKASVGLLGNVANLAAAPNAYFISYSWDLGAEGTNLAAFVREFRVYFNGATKHQVLPAASRSWTALNLAQSTQYTLRVTSVDVFGTESVGATLNATTLTVAPGLVDAGFSSAANAEIRGAAVQPDGKFILTGNFTTMAGVGRNRIARLMLDGTLDTGFNPNANGTIWCVTVLADGRLLVGGEFTTIAGASRSRIARLMPDGTLDASFNASVNSEVRGILPQADGAVLINGSFTQVNAVTRNRLARLDSSGSLDASFNPNANNTIMCAVPQTDGKYIITGLFTQVGGVTRNRVARINGDGSLDSSFNPNANGVVEVAALQPDGKILMGGSFTTVAGTGRARLARLNADGSLESGFNPDANDAIYSLALQADRRIILGGAFTLLNGTTRSRIGRLNSDGSLDTTFTPSANQVVHGAAPLADGRVLTVGHFTNINGTTCNRLALLTNDPATQTLGFIDSTSLLWQRGGSSPVIHGAEFDLSSDGGLTWQPLGAASTTVDGWTLAGQQLPLSALLRARSQSRGGLHAASISQIETRVMYEALASPALWRRYHFGPQSSMPHAQETADPDHDGLPNLMERAFARNPLVSDAHQMPAWSSDGSRLSLQFTPPQGVQSITYGVEWSPTLSADDWHPLPDLNPTNGFRFELPFATGPRAFVRIKVISAQ